MLKTIRFGLKLDENNLFKEQFLINVVECVKQGKVILKYQPYYYIVVVVVVYVKLKNI
ncbi:unnamed protein product [marine sediment metagenome]|uniref:Uncharacterized protein n=1 Tax=marine sediment metagenome TaxID=412755 RepID=X1INR0_9ZZZZ